MRDDHAMSLPELEVKCWQCWGLGRISVEDHGEMMECPECGGIGWIPTEEGNRLLLFLKRHLSLEVEEVEEEEESPLE